MKQTLKLATRTETAPAAKPKAPALTPKERIARAAQRLMDECVAFVEDGPAHERPGRLREASLLSGYAMGIIDEAARRRG